MGITERVTALCSEKKITVHALEKSLGLGHSSVSKWNSHAPRIDSVMKIAEFFNVTAEYLYSGKDMETHISDFEYQIIVNFRKSQMQDAILRLLEMEPEAVEGKKIV